MPKSTALAIAAVVGILIGVFAVAIPLSIGEAWILQHVWQWYAVAQFGMPPLKLAHCFLLTYAIGLMIKSNVDKEDKEHPWTVIVGQVLSWILFLGLGWWLRNA
jgi:uncharacterized membrane protein AbrB (regulator of aidB expression)